MKRIRTMEWLAIRKASILLAKAMHISEYEALKLVVDSAVEKERRTK